LSEYTTDELRAALALAEEREAEREAEEAKAEAEEAKARFPKCKCGKPITQVCYPTVSYVFRGIYDRQGRATVGMERALDEQDNAPGECNIDEYVAWGACDDEKCETSEWALIAYNDLSWRG
jgi:hypothetical protein